MKPIELPILSNWQDHQDLALRLYTFEFHDHIVEEFGRNGQAQGGIDILIRSKDGKQVIGVQCRRVAKLDLEASYKVALTCGVNLTEFWVFTSLPRDAKLQTVAANLTKGGPIPCLVESWDDIERKVQRHVILLQEFFPTFGWAKVNALQSVLVKLNMPPQSYMELMIVSMPHKLDNYWGSCLWIADMHKLGNSTTTHFGEHKNRLREVFRDYESFFIQSWLDEFKSFDEILALSVGNKAVEARAEYYDEYLKWLDEFGDEDEEE